MCVLKLVRVPLGARLEDIGFATSYSHRWVAVAVSRFERAVKGELGSAQFVFAC